MAYTSPDNYFEGFRTGDVYEHVRGRTVSNEDNVWLTHLSLNTAQAHFNLDYAREMMDGAFRERLVMGGVTLAIVVGLTSEDLSENAFMDLGLTGIRLRSPVYRDDTLYARSEIIEVRDSDERADAGVVVYRFTGRKSDGTVVVEGERRLLVKRRSHWGHLDGNPEVAHERSA